MNREDMVWSLAFANAFNLGKSSSECRAAAANARSSALAALHFEKLNIITIERSAGSVRVVSIGDTPSPAVDVLGRGE